MSITNGERIKNQILKLINRSPDGLTITEVSKKLKYNRITATKYLEVLTAEKKIRQRKIGKTKIHYPKRRR